MREFLSLFILAAIPSLVGCTPATRTYQVEAFYLQYSEGKFFGTPTKEVTVEKHWIDGTLGKAKEVGASFLNSYHELPGEYRVVGKGYKVPQLVAPDGYKILDESGKTIFIYKKTLLLENLYTR